MPNSDFSLRDVLDKFQLALSDVPDLFPSVREVEPSPLLRSLVWIVTGVGAAQVS
jgi:hypothetical protein